MADSLSASDYADLQAKNSHLVRLYVPLRIFGCLGAVLKGADCNNPMHFHHKLMHTLKRRQD
jgi:hypothetical protein